MKSLGCIRKTAIYEQLLLLVVFLLVPTWGVAETTATRLAGLPKFVGLGLKGDRSGDINWMVDSGTPWTYRYGYLSGAVNSSGGWATWVSPAGEYATQFMNTSSQKGYISVFSYYTIVQSAPNASVEPPFANLVNASTMKAYFQDFRLLMKKAHIFGKPVIVHVEPDLWGYIQGKSSNPAGTPVAVASSGDSELAGLENNARGLAKAFIKIRNTHAPKVIIAWHASQWATNVDLTAQNADGVTIGNSVATFYKALGAKFDLIFFGPSDRDAAWREIVKNQGMDAWWDQDDFNRFRSFIATITKATATKGMIWQIPLGNTSYRTCNNTSGHYQDNRVEYFLEPGNLQRMVDYVNSGIIGMLFGGGFKDQTSVTDVKKDGITNPAPINGNNLVSKFSDDDGGNLRILSKQYYSKGTIPHP